LPLPRMEIQLFSQDPVAVPTELRTIELYENLTKILSGRVIKFVDCGFIASYYKVFIYTYADPHRPSE
jgi:hypothetical protein